MSELLKCTLFIHSFALQAPFGQSECKIIQMISISVAYLSIAPRWNWSFCRNKKYHVCELTSTFVRYDNVGRATTVSCHNKNSTNEFLKWYFLQIESIYMRYVESVCLRVSQLVIKKNSWHNWAEGKYEKFLETIIRSTKSRLGIGTAYARICNNSQSES